MLANCQLSGVLVEPSSTQKCRHHVTYLTTTTLEKHSRFSCSCSEVNCLLPTSALPLSYASISGSSWIRTSISCCHKQPKSLQMHLKSQHPWQ